MAKLRKFTLSYDDNKGDWKLQEDGSTRAEARFETKSEATTGGALSKALGKEGGSVKIQKITGDYQEERTFPRSADPKKSPG